MRTERAVEQHGREQSLIHVCALHNFHHYNFSDTLSSLFAKSIITFRQSLFTFSPNERAPFGGLAKCFLAKVNPTLMNQQLTDGKQTNLKQEVFLQVNQVHWRGGAPSEVSASRHLLNPNQILVFLKTPKYYFLFREGT